MYIFVVVVVVVVVNLDLVQVHMFLFKCVLFVDVIWSVHNGSSVPNIFFRLVLPHLPRLLHHLPPPLPLRETNHGRLSLCLLLDSRRLPSLCTLLLCESFNLLFEFRRIPFIRPFKGVNDSILTITNFSCLCCVCRC